jgi:hypothetical protein
MGFEATDAVNTAPRCRSDAAQLDKPKLISGLVFSPRSILM